MVTNPNDYPVHITGATLTDVAVANAPGCTKDNAGLALGTVPNNAVIAAKPSQPHERHADGGGQLGGVRPHGHRR